jgi:DUF971 family protein
LQIDDCRGSRERPGYFFNLRLPIANRQSDLGFNVSQVPSTDPVDISVSAGRREVRIVWRGGHESVYPFDLLRKECPCALCNDQRGTPSASAGLSLTVLSGPVLKAGEVQVKEVSPVGRYAINFVWSDGHDSGIYAFDFLRAMCPCPSCQAERAAASR